MPFVFLVILVVIAVILVAYGSRLKKNITFLFKVFLAILIGFILLRYGQAVLALVAVLFPFLLRISKILLTNIGFLSFITKL